MPNRTPGNTHNGQSTLCSKDLYCIRYHTSRVQHSITPTVDDITLSLKILGDEVAVTPGAREDIEISLAIFLVTPFTPKCDGHAEERLRNDEVSFLARILNVPAVLVPDLDLHAEDRSGELGSVKRNDEVAADDCVPAGNDQQECLLWASAILGGYAYCLQQDPSPPNCFEGRLA